MILDTILFLCLLVMARNGIVYRANMRAIDMAGIEARKLIANRDPNFMAPINLVEPNFWRFLLQILDLTKWTFRQFYPELAQSSASGSRG